MTHNEKMRLRRFLDASRKAGGAALLVAASKLDALAYGLSLELPEGFSYEAVEAAVRKEVKEWSSLTLPAWDSDEEKAIAAAKRKTAGPTTADYAKMPAPERLAAINAQKLREMEAEKAKAARLPADHGLEHEKLVQMTPGEKLELARELATEAAGKPKPAKEVTAPEKKQMTASQRLSLANVEQQAKAKKAS